MWMMKDPIQFRWDFWIPLPFFENMNTRKWTLNTGMMVLGTVVPNTELRIPLLPHPFKGSYQLLLKLMRVEFGIPVSVNYCGT